MPTTKASDGGAGTLTGTRAVVALGLLWGSSTALSSGCSAPLSEPPCAQPSAPRGAPSLTTQVRLEPVTVADTIAETVSPPSDEISAPMLAWDGTSWDLAWGARFVALDADARPRAPIEDRMEGGAATGFHPGTCRHGLVAEDTLPGRSVAVWLDTRGSVRSLVGIEGLAPDLAEHAGRWWIASDVSTPMTGALSILASDDEQHVFPVERIEDSAISSPRIVASDLGATVVWVDAEGIVMRTVERGDARPARTVRVMSANIWARGAIEAIALPGDHVAVGAADGSTVHVAITDPANERVLAGPIAVARTTVIGVRPGMVAIPEHDLIAVCNPAGPGPWGGPDVQDRVELVLVGATTAEPVARAVVVARAESIRAAACGWNGRELLVAWSSVQGGRAQLGARRVRFVAETPTVVTHLW